MNRMLVVVFDNEKAAEAGDRALHRLHSEGLISLYALGVLARDAKGKFTVLRSDSDAPLGLGLGLAVGGLIGLMTGPGGLAAGALAGGVIGAVRDSWVAGVGLDFIEEARSVLQPGRVALVAEVEEEWTGPVDARMAEVGGVVHRRARAALAKEHVRSDITAFKGELAGLRDEGRHAGSEATDLVLRKTTQAKAGLEAALERARHALEDIKREGDLKLEALKIQIGNTEGDMKSSLYTRASRVRKSYEKRSAKLSKAWGFAKEALKVS